MCVALSSSYGYMPVDIQGRTWKLFRKCEEKMMSRESAKEKLSILLGVPERLISLSFPDLKEKGTLWQLTWKTHTCPLSSRWRFCWLSSPCYPCHLCPWALVPSFQKQVWGEEEHLSLLAPNPSLNDSKVNVFFCVAFVVACWFFIWFFYLLISLHSPWKTWKDAFQNSSCLLPVNW